MMPGQNDPYMKRVTQKGTTFAIFIILSLFGLIFVGFSLQDFLRTNGIITRGILFLLLGLFFLGLMAFAVVNTRTATRQWLMKTKQREVMQHTPERFLATRQPESDQQRPQPAQVTIKNNPISLAIWQGIIFGVIYVVVEGYVDPAPYNNPLKLIGLILFVGLFYSLATSGIYSLLQKLSGKSFLPIQSSMEVTGQGITTRYYSPEVKIFWQDARMFTTYTIMANRKQIKIYEILSEKEVARWAYYPQLPSLFKVAPKMSQQEYDRWMEGAIGYIHAQTGLPLIDVDQNN